MIKKSNIIDAKNISLLLYNMFIVIERSYKEKQIALSEKTNKKLNDYELSTFIKININLTKKDKNITLYTDNINYFSSDFSDKALNVFANYLISKLSFSCCKNEIIDTCKKHKLTNVLNSIYFYIKALKGYFNIFNCKLTYDIEKNTSLDFQTINIYYNIETPDSTYYNTKPSINFTLSTFYNDLDSIENYDDTIEKSKIKELTDITTSYLNIRKINSYYANIAINLGDDIYCIIYKTYYTTINKELDIKIFYQFISDIMNKYKFINMLEHNEPQKIDFLLSLNTEKIKLVYFKDSLKILKNQNKSILLTNYKNTYQHNLLFIL